MDDIISAAKGFEHGSRDGGEVDRRTNGAQNLPLREVAVHIWGRERISGRVSNIEPAVAKGVVEIDGGAHTLGLNMIADFLRRYETTVDGVDVKDAEFPLALDELVFAATGLCPVGLELGVDRLIEDLNIKGL
jgi:hypothetical protein